MNEQTTFELRADLSNLPQTIDFNFEELKSELADNLTYYNNLGIALTNQEKFDIKKYGGKSKNKDYHSSKK